MPAQAAVAPAGGARGPGGQQQQQQQQQSPLMSMIRMVMFWYFLSNFIFKKPPKDPQMVMRNLFTKGEEIDMWVYVSEKSYFTDFTDESALVWYESGVPYAVYTPEARRTLEYTYYPSKAVQNNGTLFAHMFFARSGYSPDPSDPGYSRTATFSRTHPLVVYHKRPKEDKRKSLVESPQDAKKSLLKGTAGEAREDTNAKEESAGESVSAEGTAGGKPDEWISFMKPNLTISLVDDFTAYQVNQIPAVIAPYILYDPESGGYFPVVFPNEFWLLKDKLIPMNATVSNVSLSLVLETLPAWRLQIYLGTDQSFRMQESFGATMEGEADELKRVFLEGNPVLLAITLVVSILHSVFDFLAFKNDIQFWRQNKSMEGLSARTIVLNFACQFIIFFYLLDNDTSWIILISAGVSCAIEFWKIGKAMHIEVDRSGRFPILRFRDRESYTQTKTKEYDALAMKYLSYALYPLVIGYSVYSLVYETHRSWYSWILGSLTGCVYTFGFIMMCPQLFINYKLKSVAHMPWRQMTYKFLNTIVDDLFAFVIKMPTLHRLSVFRDDIVFMIFLYQRWVYPVDKQRVNEFGYGGDTSEEAATPVPGESATPLLNAGAEAAADKGGPAKGGSPPAEKDEVKGGRADKEEEGVGATTTLEDRGTSRSISEQGLSQRKSRVSERKGS